MLIYSLKKKSKKSAVKFFLIMQNEKGSAENNFAKKNLRMPKKNLGALFFSAPHFDWHT